MLFLFCVALWFIPRAASCFKGFPCSLSSYSFIPYSIVITSIGEEGAGLCASSAFVCVIIIIITLFQEDNIFGMYASLRYGPQLQR